MKKIDFRKDILPHIVAVGIFLIVVLIFFQPQLTKNRAISQHDVFQGRASGQELVDYRNETGEEGLWANSMFSGMPGYLINVNYNDTVLTLIYRTLSVGMPTPANYLFISFLCYYIMLLCFGVRPFLAMGGALMFGMTSFNTISFIAGHNSKVHAIAYMPLVIAGIRLTFQKKYLLGFALTAIALALEIKANHLQITYYLLLITVAYGIAEQFHHIAKKKTPEFFKAIGILTIAAILAVSANLGRLWTVYEYGKSSIRGKSELTVKNSNEDKAGLDKEYAFRYSNGIFEPLVMFIPNILGGSSQQQLDSDSNLGKALSANRIPRQQINQQLQSVPTYWGSQPLTAPYYLGAISFFLFAIGIAFADKKYVFWLVGIALFGVMLSWGKNFSGINYFLFDYLPGYNKFRSVTFAIIIPMFAIPLLGMLGLNTLLDKEFDKDVRKKFLIAFGATGGFALLLVLIAGFLNYSGSVDAQLGNLPDWFIAALKNDRKSLLRADAFRTFIFITLTALLIWLYFRKTISTLVMSAAIVALIGLDSGLVSKRFLNKDSFVRDPYGQFHRKTEADNYILSQNNNYQRVLYLLNPFNEARPSYHHHSIGGYHGAKLRRYQDVISYGLNDEIQEAIASLRAGTNDFSDLGIINMLNTGYFLAGNEKNAVIRNFNANGNAWFVSDVITVENPDQEIEKINEINTKTTAVIDASKFDVKQTNFSGQGSVTLVEKKPSYLKYESNNSTDGLIVFSEIYYKNGWEAYIDGNQVDILRANYVLRALMTSAGQHTIEFKFNPRPYYAGTAISSIVGYLLLLIFAGSIFKAFQNLKNEEGIDD
ncbi:MAG: YfhO family protein [Bacteroidota bacterium]